jgi:hypothetical protein
MASQHEDDIYLLHTDKPDFRADESASAEPCAKDPKLEARKKLNSNVSGIAGVLIRIQGIVDNAKKSGLMITAKTGLVLDRVTKLTDHILASTHEKRTGYQPGFLDHETQFIIDNAVSAITELRQVTNGEGPKCMEWAEAHMNIQVLLLVLGCIPVLLSIVTAQSFF